MSDNTIRSTARSRTRQRDTATTVATIITLAILLILGATVYQYAAHARPQVDTSAHSAVVAPASAGTGNTASNT